MDCGESTQVQCQRYGIKLGRIKRIFISHLHGDHFFGLPGLLSSMHLAGRREKLELYGPYGLGEILSTTFKFSDSVLNFPLEYHELTEGQQGIIYEDTAFKVRTFPLFHRINCHGYSFEEQPRLRNLIKEKIPRELDTEQLQRLKESKDVEHQGQLYRWQHYTKEPKPPKSYAFCSDTLFRPEVIQSIKGSTALYHEATFLHEREERAYQTFHTTAKQAGIVAREAGVQLLIIGHFSSRYKDLEELHEEAKEEFPKTELALEGQIFRIK